MTAVLPTILLGAFVFAGWAAASGASGGNVQPVAPHANSFSTSELHIRGSRIELHLRVQVLSIGEVIQGFDDDGDGHAEDGEIEASYDSIASYIAEHYRVVPQATSGEDAASPEMALPAKCLQIVEGPMALDPMNEVSEWVDIRFEFDAGEGEFRTLGAYVDLFEVTSPGHSDSCAVVWNGLELGAWMFADGAETHVFEGSDEMLARNAPALGRFAARGAKGIKQNWDAALVALLLVVAASRSRRSALLCGGVFAVAVALGILATPHIPVLDQYLKFSRVTSALALVYLALDYLFYRTGRTKLLEPLVFGAILGFREASLARPDLILEADPGGAPLWGLGIGLGGMLLALVLVATLALKGRGATSSEATKALGEFGEKLPPPELPYAPAAVAALVAALALGLGAWTAYGILFA